MRSGHRPGRAPWPFHGPLLAIALAAAIRLIAGAEDAGQGGQPAAADDAATTSSDLPGRPLEAKLVHLSGGRLRLSELRGQPLLLDLWATWCLPCQEQSRILQELADELSERRVAVLALNQGEDPETVRAFVERRPSHFPVVLDRRQLVSASLDVGELPALVLLDRAGKAVGLRLGLTGRREVLSLLAVLDAGSPE